MGTFTLPQGVTTITRDKLESLFDVCRVSMGDREELVALVRKGERPSRVMLRKLKGEYKDCLDAILEELTAEFFQKHGLKMPT